MAESKVKSVAEKIGPHAFSGIKGAEKREGF